VFTSDAKSRWAESWVSWPGFDKFWGNVMRDLLPHAQAQDAGLVFDQTRQEMEVTYRLPAAEDGKVKPPALFIFGPGGFQQPLTLQKAAAGLYRARVAVGDRSGLFRVRPAEVTRYFPEVGYYRQEEELTAYGNRPELLKQIARFSGGVSEPAAGNVFRGGGRRIETSFAIWPLLLGLAVLLSLWELFLRKGGWSRLRPGGMEKGVTELSYT
jgi:Ca-activated chloride channel homolog